MASLPLRACSHWTSHQGTNWAGTAACAGGLPPPRLRRIFLSSKQRTGDLTDRRSNKEMFTAVFRSFFSTQCCLENLSFQAATCWAQAVPVRKGRDGFSQQHKELRSHLGMDPWRSQAGMWVVPGSSLSHLLAAVCHCPSSRLLHAVSSLLLSCFLLKTARAEELEVLPHFN